MKKAAAILSVALLMTSGALHAGPAEDIIESLDSDADGQLSEEEAAVDPEIEVRFPMLDVNRDGYLTAQELEPALQPEQTPG